MSPQEDVEVQLNNKRTTIRMSQGSASTAMFTQQEEPSDEFHPKEAAPRSSTQPHVKHRLTRLCSLLVGVVVLLALGLLVYMIHRRNNQGGRRAGSEAYLLAQVEQHDAPDDCWMAIDNRVFDLTLYASDHPGGEKFIWAYCGQDATEPYLDQHPSKLLNTIPQYEIGALRQGVNGGSKNGSPSQQQPNTPNDDSDDDEDSEEDDYQPSPSPPAPAPAPPTQTSNCIPLDDVYLNDNRNSCYMILYDTVYDFTKYAYLHPGNPGPIWDNCGIDATVNYEQERKHNENLLAKQGFKYLLGPACL